MMRCYKLALTKLLKGDGLKTAATNRTFGAVFWFTDARLTFFFLVDAVFGYHRIIELKDIALSKHFCSSVLYNYDIGNLYRYRTKINKFVW